MRMNSPQMRISSRCIVPYAILNHEQVYVSYCNLCHLSSKFLAGVRRCGSRILSRGAQLSKPKVADVAKRSRASGANH